MLSRFNVSEILDVAFAQHMDFNRAKMLFHANGYHLSYRTYEVAMRQRKARTYGLPVWHISKVV